MGRGINPTTPAFKFGCDILVVVFKDYTHNTEQATLYVYLWWGGGWKLHEQGGLSIYEGGSSRVG